MAVFGCITRLLKFRVSFIVGVYCYCDNDS